MFVSITFKTKIRLWKVWFSCRKMFPNCFKIWDNGGKNIWEFPSDRKNFRSAPSPLHNVGTDMHFCVKCPLLQLYQHWRWGKGIFLKILFPGLYKIEEFAFRNSQNPSEIPQKKKKGSHDELFKTTVCATVYLNTVYLVILKLHRFTICLLAIK